MRISAKGQSPNFNPTRWLVCVPVHPSNAADTYLCWSPRDKPNGSNHKMNWHFVFDSLGEQMRLVGGVGI